MIDTNTFYSSLFTKIPLPNKITLNFSLLAGLFEQKTQNHFDVIKNIFILNFHLH